MIPIGHKAEIELADFLSEPLLIDFVHLCPEYSKGKKKRELADFLIEDEKLAIPIQLKFQDREKASPSRDEYKWAKKHLEAASKQLLGAIRNVEKYSIRAEHPYRGKIEFPPNNFMCKFGLVIVDYKSQPFELDQSLSRRSKNGIPIHYFSYGDFITLCQKLMSLPDLIEYLEERSTIPAWATPKINDEKNTYAYYLTHKGKFNFTLRLEDFKDQWDNLTKRHKEKFNEKELEDENVFIFNNILRILSTKEPIVVDNSIEYIKKITNLKEENRLFITRKLNKTRRIHRREISKRLIEKIIKAETSKLGFNYFAYKTDDPETIYLFLASRHSREERINQLQVMSDCVNNIYNPKRVIGIATESNNISKGRSYDFFYIEDLQPADDPKIIEMCKSFFGDMNIGLEFDFPSDKREKFSIKSIQRTGEAVLHNSNIQPRR